MLSFNGQLFKSAVVYAYIVTVLGAKRNLFIVLNLREGGRERERETEREREREPNLERL